MSKRKSSFFRRLVLTLERFISWIHAHTKPRQFLIIASTLIGITAGLGAIILKTMVHYIHRLLIHDYHLHAQYFLYLLFPLGGILLTVYIKQRFFGGKLGRGTSNVLHAILRKSGIMHRDQMYSHVITSAITVGFGGSAGLESPIVTTGASIGSNFAKTYKLIYKDRLLLLASGAAAGIAAAFNAPIAGVLFALEVLLVDVSISAFIPLILAAATGALCSRVILNDHILFTFSLKEAFDYRNVPYYILLGLLSGLVSVYYARTFQKVEEWFGSSKQKVYPKALIGGLALALLIFVFPPLFGEGYDSIRILAELNPENLLQHSFLFASHHGEWFMLLFIFITMLVKVIATSLTISGGGNGGNFAPTLFVGAFLGYTFSHIISLSGIRDLPESNFTLVAMAGILAGVFHSPLTAIFLIAEITGGYELMIPLMIVSASSYALSKYFEPHSMDAKKLAKKGHIVSAGKDKTILAALKTSRVIETDFQKVTPDTSLRDLTAVIAHSSRNTFPVVEKDGTLRGIIALDNIREIMFKTELYDKVVAKELMRTSPAIISPNEDMNSVMKKFEETGSWNLPVADEGKYLGFISKSGILNNYRTQLINISAD